MKILGLDYGDKTIGIAVYDSTIDFVYPKETIFRDKPNVLRKSFREIENIISSENIDKLVLGLPININGNEGIRSTKTREFGDSLSKRINKKIIYQDERLTTIEASEILKNNNIKKNEQKKYIDSVAACIILREYVNANKNNNFKEE